MARRMSSTATATTSFAPCRGVLLATACMEMRAGAARLAATEDGGSGTGRTALTAEAKGENAMDDARLCSCAHVCSGGVGVELVSLLESVRGSVPEHSGRVWGSSAGCSQASGTTTTRSEATARPNDRMRTGVGMLLEAS
jgi:hypothetical protein